MSERYIYYVELRNGEHSIDSLLQIITCNESNDMIQTKNSTKLNEIIPWVDRWPDKIYAWTVDFHPAPASCKLILFCIISSIYILID